jgi:hypothetical protein
LSTHQARRISIVRFWLSLAGSSLITLVGSSACGGDDDPPAQTQAGSGGSGAAAGSGGGSGGSGGAGGAKGEPQLGAACTRDADCTGGYVCDEEVKSTIPVSGAPNGSIDQYVFFGGSCTPIRATLYDPRNPGVSCDPAAAMGNQGCGPDGVCDAVGRTAQGFVVGCRKACDPEAEESGCREGYTCGLTDKYCSEGCQTDAECRIGPIDSNDDGELDMNGYDSASNVTCDPATARCVHPAGPQPSGETCVRDDDCPENGVCIIEGASVAGHAFPGGHCTRTGCESPANECDNDTVCESLRPWGASPTAPLCFQSCKVGAEPANLRIGTEGHGEGCRAGYRCHYNGGSGADSGVCVGGNYNAVTTNNIGQTCEKDSDCYSPYGLGRCLIYQVTQAGEVLPGICTVVDCAVPGLPLDVCGENNVCVSQGAGTDETNCEHNCKDASECGKGFACTDLDEDPTTPKTCVPPCLADADCKMGEKCIRLEVGAEAGLCRLQ